MSSTDHDTSNSSLGSLVEQEDDDDEQANNKNGNDDDDDKVRGRSIVQEVTK